MALVKQGSREPGLATEPQSIRVALSASLLQSTSIIEELISSGYYACSSVCLRHNMEVLARIMHIREGKPVTDNRPPNLKILPFELSKNHGRLSEICHVAKGEVHSDFISTQDDLVASPEVSYNENYSKMLFNIHIAVLLGLAWEIHNLQSEFFPDITEHDILKATDIISQILVDLNFWHRKDQNDQEKC
ncbi:MAG: hypothetical protein HY818_00040 [Acetobacterium woodii]|nr:hypothetical protein [Acetobacterium woodii]